MIFSDEYNKLRHKLLVVKEAPRVYTAPPAESQPISEKFVRALWYEQRFEKRDLKTIDGRKIKIISPGSWNLDSGPDFKNAEFLVDGEKVVGDVEVHRFASDWKKHSHGRDKNFQDVKLHVFLFNDIKSLKNSGIYQLCLADYLTEILDLNLDDYPYQSFAGLGLCGKNLTISDFEFLERFIDVAGEGRLLIRSSQISDDFDEELYKGFLTALGYKENKQQFKKLSEIVTYKKLTKILEGSSNTSSVEFIQAILFGCGGFLEVSNTGDKETDNLIERYKDIFERYKKFFSEKMNLSDWRFYKVRPPNFPQRRIYGAGFILASALKIGFLNLATSWLRSFEILSKKGKTSVVQSLTHMFVVEPKGYFAVRAKFGKPWNAKPSSLIGPSRAMSIIVNTVLPVLYRWARSNEPSLEEVIYKFYDELPLIEINRTVRKMGSYLLGAYFNKNLKITREKRSQGLIQIFQDFCGDKPTECRSCLLPDALRIYFESL